MSHLTEILHHSQQADLHWEAKSEIKGVEENSVMVKVRETAPRLQRQTGSAFGCPLHSPRPTAAGVGLPIVPVNSGNGRKFRRVSRLILLFNVILRSIECLELSNKQF
jgi:hypothetical protein